MRSINKETEKSQDLCMQTVKRKRIKTENAIDNLKASFYKKNSNKNGNNGEEENGSYKFPVFLFASGVS